MTLAGLRNLTKLCHTVLQTPPKFQPMESFLPLLHIFAPNTPIIYGATQGQAPPPSRILLCLNTMLEIFPLSGWGLAGWAPGTGSWSQPLARQRGYTSPLRFVQLPPLAAFLFCMRQFLSLFHSDTWLPNLVTGAHLGKGLETGLQFLLCAKFRCIITQSLHLHPLWQVWMDAPATMWQYSFYFALQIVTYA